MGVARVKTAVQHRTGFLPAQLIQSRRWRALLPVLALFLGACSVVPPAPPPPAPSQRLAMGLCEDYPEETRSIDRAKRDLKAVHDSGARVLRIAFGWDAMEAAEGRYDWDFWDEYVRAAVEDYGLQLIPYICYTPKWAASDQGDNYWRSPPRDPADFGRFVAAIVHRYRSRIHSWEPWNEPDIQAYGLGTPHQFAALVEEGSAAVRAADPKAKIVLGGMAGEVDFLRRLLHDEGVGRFVDVINIHSYFETWHPNPIERLPEYITAVAGLIRDTGGTQSLWMAETGYSGVGSRLEISSVYRTHFRSEHTELAQAGALIRTVLTVAATRQVSVLAWYRIHDLPAGEDVIGDDNNRHLGLFRADGAAKPALPAFAFLAQRFSQPYEVVAAQVTVTQATNAHPRVQAFRFRDGRCLVAAWLAMPEEPGGRDPVPDPRAATIAIVVPSGTNQRIVTYDSTAQEIRDATTRLRLVGGRAEMTTTVRGGEVRLVEILP